MFLAKWTIWASTPAITANGLIFATLAIFAKIYTLNSSSLTVYVFKIFSWFVTNRTNLLFFNRLFLYDRLFLSCKNNRNIYIFFVFVLNFRRWDLDFLLAHFASALVFPLHNIRFDVNISRSSRKTIVVVRWCI